MVTDEGVLVLEILKRLSFTKVDIGELDKDFKNGESWRHLIMSGGLCLYFFCAMNTVEPVCVIEARYSNIHVLMIATDEELIIAT